MARSALRDSDCVHRQTEDWVKQSIPFSYVSVEAQSLDGASHAVQMYSDISAGERDWIL